MQFLVDAQLPPALARWISVQGYSASHVADIGMSSALDLEIWDRAYGDGAVIITKDEDFATLRTIRPDGPTVIWLRTPNCRRQRQRLGTQGHFCFTSSTVGRDSART